MIEGKIEKDEKPVYTQAMSDAGEFPPVGCSCLVLEEDGEWYECFIIGWASDGYLVYEIDPSVKRNDWMYNGENTPSVFMPIDTLTEKEKAVDLILAEWPYADRATLEFAYDCWIDKK